MERSTASELESGTITWGAGCGLTLSISFQSKTPSCRGAEWALRDKLKSSNSLSGVFELCHGKTHSQNRIPYTDPGSLC
jgi:hypothetical protein